MELASHNAHTIVRAYGDLNRQSFMPNGKYPTQELHYLYPEWVGVYVARHLMQAALGPTQSYNEFRVEDVFNLIEEVAPNVVVRPGREYSVVLYIRGTEVELAKLLRLKNCFCADEADIQLMDGEPVLRMWWD